MIFSISTKRSTELWFGSLSKVISKSGIQKENLPNRNITLSDCPTFVTMGGTVSV